MANLINGNGVTGITAQIDADFYEGLSGGNTGVMAVGQKMAAEIVSNVPRVYDGVILTKEGRRIQIDYDTYDDFTIPAGAEGVTAYYIIGYKLVTASDDTQSCTQFVQAMASATETITENMLKDGNAEVYISLYRVTQVDGVNTLSDCLLPPLTTLQSQNALCYQAGETVHFYTYVGALLTSTKTAIVFTIPVNRILTYVNNVEHVASSISIYQNGTRLVDSASLSSMSSVTYVLGNNCIIVTIRKSSGFGGTNNAPVMIQGYVDLLFS